ncbi:MAG: type II secretion system minor pseudopilin GspJ [Gammaproteobacteria bacterium]|nr:type II secretion system minor pseudopilin GspJ [Gammaproteobacteria bacterium]MDH3758397.1 type II secretion system minor pseudopilin GspJ [Gammaproteobacteria bacterium]MDH3846475.1 type II secretion system minor pseudopilin GspJ [Gammaproteobacteria bacterium]MDH3863170.1 type II secretion system minor pseudopilin GspJ [Gammaproteobacteria bacterium]MDH3905758.1 type II secretion system minor pseudopilin GspJ [Gammaproteobacteria bacterium]
MRARLRNGFTLIEVLVALAVFGVLSVMAYMALGQTLSNADLLGERMQRLKAIQRSIRYLDSDLMQTSPRPVRGLLGDGYEPAIRTSFGSEYALEVTHGGWTNPAGLPRGTLQRSAYRIEDGELIRYHWRVLDRTINNEPIQTVLLDGVESIVFRYLTSDGEGSEQWPPANVPGPGGFRLRPKGVEVVLTLTDEGEIRRLVEIAP